MKEVVVCDTNLLVSAAIFPNSVPAQALDKVTNDCLLVVSIETLAELFEVLNRSKFDKYIDLETRLQFFDAYQERSLLIEVIHAAQDCRDPKDDKFLNLSRSASARYLITGDPDLLEMNTYYGIQILPPAEFLKAK
ncbi:putative toxin-antitoxin system toxin component, PIN family [Telluribacter sp.]|jgi:putative PIN family toxin of toxin-antitoxin system|uniref:putative toxin-antitoxin system toxin component, PIN family n=1 Tax=Telluribacter sp. TaxID=1978767 RepID=UPI002E11177F|nr:putative toxin-antitoxin system toxin component, PIN family [Telluribacter sp.]